jgi:hypothetical protein
MDVAAWIWLRDVERRDCRIQAKKPDRLRDLAHGNHEDAPAERPRLIARIDCALKHDPEKWMPVFRKDHAPSKI